MKMRIFYTLSLLIAAGLGWVIFNGNLLKAKLYEGPIPQQQLERIDYAKELSEAPAGVSRFVHLQSPSQSVYVKAFADISENWEDSGKYQMLEMARFVRRNRRQQIFEFLIEKTGQNFEGDLDSWLKWAWKEEFKPTDDYAMFKRLLYRRLDPRFGAYFEHTENAKIRLDEIQWGGVVRDGIPPLKDPKMLKASQADYLDDSNVVYGISLNGDSRCYPKRILAWHEMFKDTIGGESVAGVY